jgi:3D-(3,5/4)-trihydroxycyclohexane-1,2-dione acylhydrolase (decyclizing)
MSTIRLTMAQALTRFLAAQRTVIDGETVPLFAGVWAIFGHGNVAGLGEALHAERSRLPTFRAHNEQAMAHAAIAFAKASRRRRMMACTTSIGPGATNMVTAAAVAHVNRLPVLLLPGDVFANRRPDPVLQQVEDFGDGTVSANDCFRPVSRYFDRISRPEQIIPALGRAMQVLTDPAECGPVTLALCQDTQTEAYDFPESFFAERAWTPRRIRPDEGELAAALEILKAAHKPIIVAGGGVLYAEAEGALADFSARFGVPVTETQAGKSSLAHDHSLALGAIGVTGTGAANALAEDADVVLAIGTRFQDFTTGSWALFKNPARRIVGLNVQPFDAMKHGAQSLVADARVGLDLLAKGLEGWRADAGWTRRAVDEKARWLETAARYTGPTNAAPSDAQVIGAVQRSASPSDIVVCAAGGLPGELHKLWQSGEPGGYHLEYGYSCMGYEIAGGVGIKMADPSRDVYVMVGDGSYLMLHTELVTSLQEGYKIIIVLVDNSGYQCIRGLQMSSGSPAFGNEFRYRDPSTDRLDGSYIPVDFAQNAESLGAVAFRANTAEELQDALSKVKTTDRSTLIHVRVDVDARVPGFDSWWDVPIAQVSGEQGVREALEQYQSARSRQRYFH